MIVKRLLISIVLLFTVIPHARPDEFSKFFDKIKLPAVDILTRFPPERFYYLGIGNSPACFIALFQTLGVKHASNLPLTNLASSQYTWVLPPEFSAKLTEHFDRFVPTEEQLRGKSLLILDYINFGNALVKSTEYLSEYYGRKNINVDITALGILSQNISLSEIQKKRKNPTDKKVGFYIVWAPHLFGIYKNKGMRPYGEWGQFDLFKDPPPSERNPKYEDLKQLMSEELKSRGIDIQPGQQGVINFLEKHQCPEALSQISVAF